MAKLTEIFKGMYDGPKAINDNLNNINEDLSNLNTKVTKTTSSLATIKGTEYQSYDGFVLSNGAKWNKGPGWLAVAELQGGWRVVTLSIDVKLPDFNASHSKAIVTFPKKYAPLHTTPVTMPSSGRTNARWNVSNGGIIMIEQISDASGLNSDYWFPLNITYVTKDH